MTQTAVGDWLIEAHAEVTEGFAGLIIRVLAHLIINKLHFLILPI